MAAPKGTVVYGPWAERNGVSESSVYDLRESMRLHLESIEAARTAIADMWQLFSEARSIRPVECDVTLSFSQGLCIPIQGLCDLLRAPSALPSVIVAYRYHLLVPLYSVDEQIDQLKPLIITFRPICMDFSRQAIKQQEAILRRLEQIVQLCEAIEREGRILIHRTYGKILTANSV